MHWKDYVSPLVWVCLHRTGGSFCEEEDPDISTETAAPTTQLQISGRKTDEWLDGYLHFACAIPLTILSRFTFTKSYQVTHGCEYMVKEVTLCHGRRMTKCYEAEVIAIVSAFL